MASRKEKTHALEFLAEMLSRSSRYDLLEQNPDRILVKEREDKPRSVAVVLANWQGPDYLPLVRENAQAGIYTCPVLYKDGATSFVRIVRPGRPWRADKSLKRYTPQEINQMLSLRKIEKEILEQTDNAPLSFYQPPQERLEESLRRIRMGEVILDYSHIGPRDQGYGFVHDRASIDYKLPEDVDAGRNAAELIWSGKQRDRRIVRIVPYEVVASTKIVAEETGVAASSSNLASAREAIAYRRPQQLPLSFLL